MAITIISHLNIFLGRYISFYCNRLGLFNDFFRADSNEDGRITRHEIQEVINFLVYIFILECRYLQHNALSLIRAKHTVMRLISSA